MQKKLAIDVKIAFCYYCGEDLRSPGVKLVPEIETVINNISKVYPENLRDHAIATLNKAIAILKEE